MRTQIAIALAFFAFAPVAATAAEGSQDEQSACMNDAFSVCGHAIPDRDRVAACLSQNVSRLSAPCRTVMQRYSRAATTRPQITSVRN
jgi:hypothetical protein